MRLLVGSLLCWMVAAAVCEAQGRRPPQRPNEQGPWNRDLQRYESRDGRKFERAGTFVERAGVPCVIRDAKQRLVAVFQWFPFDREEAFDKVAVVCSEDEGQTWSQPEPVRVEGLPASMMRPFDPTVVLLDDGRLRFYFTSNERGPIGPGQNGQGQNGPSRPRIYSATSEDGVTYRFEPGERSVGQDGIVDCSVVKWQRRWHMFAHIHPEPGRPPGKGYHAVSEDGLTFERQPDLKAPEGGQWIGNALVHEDQLKYVGSGRSGLWIATSSDGKTWTDVTSIGARGGDPCLLPLAKDRWLMLCVGDVRRDAGPPPFRGPKPEGAPRSRGLEGRTE